MTNHNTITCIERRSYFLPNHMKKNKPLSLESCFVMLPPSAIKRSTLILLTIIFILFTVAEDVNDSKCPLACICTYAGGITICRHQQLVGLPENISDQVNVLDLSYNNFDGLPRTLPNFKILKTLLLAYNRIFTIDKFSLRSSSLEKLDLSYNSIKNWSKIHPHVLSGTNKLRELDLSHNPIQKLDYNSSLSSSSLEILSMQNCSLTDIPIPFLSRMTHLKHLIISKNKFIILPTFYSTTLRSLDISFCHIRHVPETVLLKLPALQSLYMSYNEELRFFRQLKSTSLTLINASNCNLEHINLTELQNLTQAFLPGNRLMKISAKYFGSAILRSLDLSDNAIKLIDVNAFSDLLSLEILDLSTNVFSDLKPNTFINNKKLTTLNLSRTYLTHMAKFNILSLRSLDISFNEIQTLNEDILTLMPTLQILKLSRNLITKLPRSIISNSLKQLDLSTCQLFSIQNETFAYLPNLEELNIAGNRFTSLQPSYLPNSLKRIILDNNPWRCECHATEFRQLYKYLVKSPAKIWNENRLVCQSPENVSGYFWYQACAYVWYNQSAGRDKKMWYYLIFVTVALSLMIGAGMCVRIHRRKLLRERRERERQQLLAQERIRILRMQQQRERAQQNAPDPRDFVGPPSYAEAIRMPRIDNAHSSSVEGRNSLLGSNPDLSKRNKRKKNAQRKQARDAQAKNKTRTSETTQDNGNEASTAGLFNAEENSQSPNEINVIPESPAPGNDEH